jgi:hypothetical protein
VSSLAVAATVLLVGCGQSLEQDLDALRDGGRLSVTDAGRGVPVDGAVDPESLSDAGAGPEASSDAGADEHAPVDAGLATAEDGGEVTITASLTPGLVKAGGQVVLSLMVATTRVALLEIDAVLRSPAGSPVHIAHLTGQRVAPASPLRHEEAVALSPTAEAGVYALDVTARWSQTSGVAREVPRAATLTVEGSPPGLCAGTSVFCDDFASASPPASYQLERGTWTRAGGLFTATHEVAWQRAGALLPVDFGDFDVTVLGRSRGDAGFGLVYGAQAQDNGFAVIVHPGQFQGVYLKELNAGQADRSIHSVELASPASGTLLRLRVRRVGATVTVWLDGSELFTADDGGAGRHGPLGLIVSVTDQTVGSGAEFSLLRVDTAEGPSSCVPTCDGKTCGPDGCGGQCSCAASSWLSGAASPYAADGSFGRWRGEPITIGGTWVNGNAEMLRLDTLQANAEWGAWTGAIDVAIGAIDHRVGESWAAAASGAYDARWRQSAQAFKAVWTNRGKPEQNLYIRFAHEMNGDWYPWRVASGEAANFKKAWIRWAAIIEEVLPQANKVWCVNKNSSPGYAASRDLWPGKAHVDVYSVDWYNNYPWVSTPAALEQQFVRRASNGNPEGLEAHRQEAQANGVPFAVSEWSNSAPSSASAGGGGGEAPELMNAMDAWLRAHAGTGPGQVKYEVLFNLWTRYALYGAEAGQPQTAARYAELTWGE